MIKKSLAFEFMLVAFGIQIVIAAGMNNLIVGNPNEFLNTLGVLVGGTMQIIGVIKIDMSINWDDLRT